MKNYHNAHSEPLLQSASMFFYFLYIPFPFSVSPSFSLWLRSGVRTWALLETSSTLRNSSGGGIHFVSFRFPIARQLRVGQDVYVVRRTYVCVYFLFLVYSAARSTPRPQSRCVATLCISAVYTLYNDTMAARMATLTGRKIVGPLRCAGKFSFFLISYFYINIVYMHIFLVHILSEKPLSKNFSVF